MKSHSFKTFINIPARKPWVHSIKSVAPNLYGIHALQKSSKTKKEQADFNNEILEQKFLTTLK